jgi:hypothetical protein
MRLVAESENLVYVYGATIRGSLKKKKKMGCDDGLLRFATCSCGSAKDLSIHKQPEDGNAKLYINERS